MAFPTDPANATTLDNSTTSATLELFRAVLGPVNTDYYLKAFTRFDAKDRAGPSWNWAAGLLTLNWMALRQLWGAALAYVGAMLAATLLVLGMGRLVFGLSLEDQAVWLLALLALSIAIPGVFGNAWLYTASRKKMELALSANATLADACTMLKRQAATRQRLTGLVIGNGVLLAGVAAIAVSLQGLQGSNALPAAPTAKPAQPEEAAPKAQPAASNSPRTAASAPADALPPSATASKPVTTASATVAPASATVAEASAPVATASGPAVPSPLAEASANVPKVTTPSDRSPLAAMPSNPSVPAGQKAAKTKALPEKLPAPKAKASGEPDQKFWVNVGLFADENNARNAAAKLEDAGIAPAVSVMETTKGKRTRVRAGPFASLAEAERAADKIQFIGLDAVVAHK